ncbi:hypothetical protein [Methylocaldum sp.]|uniref:hypothetical protein n=1 Tax=Methylocaldum sp. TaxID=1969727 RepID=UPI002D23B97A|nr:hypothetical protein [Methylocaldum sp.]HYE36606.1 hypothetical protein [Methylocaldum sp.]
MAPFSWLVFIVAAGLIALCIAPFVVRIAKAGRSHALTQSSAPQRFPSFGWIGCALTIGAWILAWNRFEWFRHFQEFTFTPLWIGYILTVNALCYRRSGRCLLLDRPGFLLVLFPLSALFWWSFEYLNGFVGNWRYLGISEPSPWAYAVNSTLAFSTVLPAIASTVEFLETFPRLYQGLDCFHRPWPSARQVLGGIGFVAGVLGLALIGMFPGQLYPVIWLAPIFIISGLQTRIWNRSLLSTALATGDWRKPWLYALAGLVCGFYWELWNYLSLAHWEYQIAYVGRFKLFEMPILGYSGYLPFGILCAAFADCLNSETLSTTAKNRYDGSFDHPDSKGFSCKSHPAK